MHRTLFLFKILCPLRIVTLSIQHHHRSVREEQIYCIHALCTCFSNNHMHIYKGYILFALTSSVSTGLHQHKYNPYITYNTYITYCSLATAVRETKWNIVRGCELFSCPSSGTAHVSEMCYCR